MSKTGSQSGGERSRSLPTTGSPASATKDEVARQGQVSLRSRAEQIARIVARGKKITERGRLGLVIRDSFTMPLADYELIGALKKRCLGLGIAIKKSELLRAGLATLQRLSDENLTQVAAAVESVKTGRPRSGNKKSKTNRTRGGKR